MGAHQYTIVPFQPIDFQGFQGEADSDPPLSQNPLHTYSAHRYANAGSGFSVWRAFLIRT